MGTQTTAFPRKTLANQLDRLDTILDGLSDAIPDAVADAVEQGVRAAVQAAVTELLAHPEIVRQLGAGADPANEATSGPSWLGRVWAGCCQVIRGACDLVVNAVRAVRDHVWQAVQAAVNTTSEVIAVVSAKARSVVRRCWLPLLLALAALSTSVVVSQITSPLTAVLLGVVAMPVMVGVALWLRPELLFLLCARLAA